MFNLKSLIFKITNCNNHNTHAVRATHKIRVAPAFIRDARLVGSLLTKIVGKYISEYIM